MIFVTFVCDRCHKQQTQQAIHRDNIQRPYNWLERDDYNLGYSLICNDCVEAIRSHIASMEHKSANLQGGNY